MWQEVTGSNLNYPSFKVEYSAHMRIHTSSRMDSYVRGVLEYVIYPGASTISFSKAYGWVDSLTDFDVNLFWVDLGCCVF